MTNTSEFASNTAHLERQLAKVEAQILECQRRGDTSSADYRRLLVERASIKRWQELRKTVRVDP